MRLRQQIGFCLFPQAAGIFCKRVARIVKLQGTPDSKTAPAQEPHAENRRGVKRFFFPLLFIGAGLVLGHWWSEWADSASTKDVSKAESERNLIIGPWGKLEVVRIEIERPDEFIYSEIEPPAPTRWFFHGHSPEQLAALFNQDDLKKEQRRSLLDQRAWTIQPDGIWITPSRDLVLGLSPEARARLYGILGKHPANVMQDWPYKLRSADMNAWSARSGLSPATAGLMQRLVYRNGEVVCFADLNEVLEAVTNAVERRRLVKVLSRQPTVLVKLHVAEGEDVEPLVNYWAKEGRAKDVRPLLESLARTPGGATLDIAHLLTPLARMLVYTYPFPSEDPLVRRRDCVWTSMNFFNEEPDDRFHDVEITRQVIAKEYYPVQNDPTFGDVIFFYNASNKVQHVVVYVAANIVFSKNGAHFNQPWVLTELEDVIADYTGVQRPRLVVYRPKHR